MQYPIFFLVQELRHKFLYPDSSYECVKPDLENYFWPVKEQCGAVGAAGERRAERRALRCLREERRFGKRSPKSLAQSEEGQSLNRVQTKAPIERLQYLISANVNKSIRQATCFLLFCYG